MEDSICSLKEVGRKARRLGVSDNYAGVTEEDLEWAEWWRPRQRKLETSLVCSACDRLAWNLFIHAVLSAALCAVSLC